MIVTSNILVLAKIKVMIIFFSVPDPSVTVSSTPITAGSSVTVICTVELNQYVDVGLTVNIQWTGPDSLVISPTDPLMESTNRYTSTITFMSFGRVQSGVYACSATISSDTLMTSGTPIMGIERITVGKLLDHFCGHIFSLCTCTCTHRRNFVLC